MEFIGQILPQDENRRKGWVTSIVAHALLLLLLLLPFLKFSVPPPGQQGILVNLGIPDIGDGNDKPDTQNKELVKPKPVVNRQPQKPVEAKPVSQQPKEVQRDVMTTEMAEEIRIRKQQEEELRKRQEAERERLRQAEVARREAQEEARRKAEEEAKKQSEYDAAKKQYGTLLSGSGKGNTGTPGSQGSPNGNPNASKLTGLSTGSGMVGGGLGNRGVLHEPRISDNSQKVGRVVVNVCVDGTGNVISAKYTQRGSTTTDSDLRLLAERSSRQFKFTESDIDKQCGTVTIDFKVK